MFVINTYKKFGMQHIKDDVFLTAVGSVSAVFGGIRFVWSYLADRYSFKFSYLIVLLMNVVFGFTLISVANVKALFMIWVCMLVWAEGAHFALVPAACAKMFGPHAALMYGIAFSFGAISSISSSVLVQFYLKDIGYESFYYMASGLSLLSLLYLIFMFEERKVC